MYLQDTGNQATGQSCATPLTSGAYFDAGSKTGAFIVSVHADMLKIRSPQDLTELRAGGGIRGTIRGLSRASRKRMIEFMASVRFDGSLLFMTLTYPDEFPRDSAAWHRHFEAFRERFERHYSNWRALWRIELIDRKSGENTGAIAPHWHILMFVEKHEPAALDGLATAVQDEISQWWDEIVKSGNPEHLKHGCDVAPVRSRKHAYYYVSKYVAKESGDVLEIGRRWGRIGQFDTSNSSVALLTFDEYVQFRRLIKRWMRGRGGKYHRRFARQSASKGCAVFGIGDESNTGWFAFIFEAFRQGVDRLERERGWGE